MKCLLLLVLVIFSQLVLSQGKSTADSIKNASPTKGDKEVVDSTASPIIAAKKDDPCFEISGSKIINTCVVIDPCLTIRNGHIFNDCAISDDCIKLKKSKIIYKCGIDEKCITVKGGKFFNSCAIADPCIQIKDGIILNVCGIKNSCLIIVNSKIMDTCPTKDNCLKVVKGKVVNVCTEEFACLNDVKSKIRPDCNNCQVYSKETLLVFDARSKKFFYSKPKKELHRLNDLNKLRLTYKRPFRFEVVNLNRYLYNVNLGNSDVAFTSTESLVMQQNLIVGANNGQIQPANTYANGSSGNLGDNIFNVIQAFKPNIDKIGNLLRSTFSVKEEKAPLNDAKNKFINEFKDFYKKYNRFLPRNQWILNNFLSRERGQDSVETLLINMNFTIDSTRSDVFKSDTYRDQFIPKLDSVVKKYIELLEKFPPRTGNSAEVQEYTAKLKNLKDAAKKLDTLIKAAAYQAAMNIYNDRVKKQGNILRDSFNTLETYYNHFLDKKIIAYSVCTDSIPCCDVTNTENTYKYFSYLLTDITKAYFDFKDTLDTKPVPEPAAKPDAITPSDPSLDTIKLKVHTSDIIIENGRITGIKLHQLQDSTKPEKVVDPVKAAIKSIDSLWYEFEKSISSDFIMRQILFTRNMVAENMKYVSPPIYPYGDRLSLLFQIVASDSAKRNGVILDHTTAESLDFLVTNKPLFSFSGGTFYGFSPSYMSATYNFQQVPLPGSNTVQTNSPYQLMQTSSGRLPIGVNGLANLTTRESWFLRQYDLRLGISFGVGTVISPNLQVAYMAGGTLSIGTYQQFHITAGCMWMNVNVLKDNYAGSFNTLYAANPGTDIYNQRLKAGGFLSLSYTIFTPKGSGPTQIAATAPASTMAPASK
jgi:hypothetical protein